MNRCSSPRRPRERRSSCASFGNCKRKRRMWDHWPSYHQWRRSCQDRCHHLLSKSFPNGKNSHSNAASNPKPNNPERSSTTTLANGNISRAPSKTRPTPDQNPGPSSKSKRTTTPWPTHGRNSARRRRAASTRMSRTECGMPKGRARWTRGVRIDWSSITRGLRSSVILPRIRIGRAGWLLPLVFRWILRGIKRGASRRRSWHCGRRRCRRRRWANSINSGRESRRRNFQNRFMAIRNANNNTLMVQAPVVTRSQ
mmetsp:Transcript_8910/g.16322  ORF Transcript_8910/g.16322 Transcript_8910/m.16322 type:complete len:255 (+) Transcript_8910:471-1235(+)